MQPINPIETQQQPELQEQKEQKETKPERTKHEYLIVDTNIFLKDLGSKLQRYADHIVTVEDVIKEVRDEVSRQRIENLPYDLQTIEPTQEDIEYTVRFSKATGDFRNLSMQDMKVIALAVRFVREKLPFLELAKKPGEKRRVLNDSEKIEKIKELKKNAKAVEINATEEKKEIKSFTWSVPVQEEGEEEGNNDPRFPKLGAQLNSKQRPRFQTQYDYDPDEEDEREKINPFEDEKRGDEDDGEFDDDELFDDEYDNEFNDDGYDDYNEEEDNDDSDDEIEEVEEETEPEIVSQQVTSTTSIETENDDETEKKEERMIRGSEETETEFIMMKVPTKKTKEVEIDEDGFITVGKKGKKEMKKKDEGFTEWVTPSNCHQLIKKKSFEDKPIKPLRVVCMTADYTMQNVMMQMGIRVMSTDGKMIRKIMKWMLKCVICQEQIFDMSKKFCPKCGYHDLRRISYYTLANGQIKENFNPNKMDKDFLKTMGIDLDDLEELRNAIKAKAELLISELT